MLGWTDECSYGQMNDIYATTDTLVLNRQESLITATTWQLHDIKMTKVKSTLQIKIELK